MSTASTDFDWNDAAISRLKALWAEGHSTAEIGRRMGISKNAVIGKSHRLDLAARPSPIRPGGQAKERRQRRISCPSLAELQGRPPVEAKPPITVPPPVRVCGTATGGAASAGAAGSHAPSQQAPLRLADR